MWEEISGGVDQILLGKKEVNSRAYCSAFNFKGADQQKKVGQLSGGERNRVHLAKMLKSGANLLLLDEPTNDLDVDTLRALEEALEDFAGCAVIISHDRWFLDRIATHMLAFLFRWFLDMNMVEESFDPTVFTKNRERLMEHEVGRRFFDAVVRQAREAGLMSTDHFTVDGTLIEAWASLKSFRPKEEKASDRPTDGDPGNPTVDFHGEKRSNETHQSTTDPESRLMRKAQGRRRSSRYGAHVLMENRNGLLIDLDVTPATGTAETEAAEAMLKRQARKGVQPQSLGADKGYDTKGFVSMLRGRKITPHVAQKTKRRGGSAIDGRTTRHGGYAVSQKIRKRVEEIGGWIKVIGGFRKTRFKGDPKDATGGMVRRGRL